MWDVTVWDIFAPSYSGHAADEAGSVANLAEAAKRRLYSELAVGHHFAPIGIDSLGVFGHSALKFKELGFRNNLGSQVDDLNCIPRSLINHIHSEPI